jgi:hypothetical protein
MLYSFVAVKYVRYRTYKLLKYSDLPRLVLDKQEALPGLKIQDGAITKLAK